MARDPRALGEVVMQRDDERLSRIYDRTGGYCHICGKKLAFGNYGLIGKRGCWEIEHSKARANGGSDHGNNLYAACIPCNRSKRDGTTRAARGYHGRTAAPLSVKKRTSVRRTNAVVAGGAAGLTALALGASGPAGWLVAGLGAAIGHSLEPDPQKGKRRRRRR
jgi:hypothetical protein